jgi:hypothetical protein
VAFQTGGLGALNMSGNELKNFIDAMTKKGVPPAQVNQIAQQAQAVAANNPGALRSFLKTAASRFGLGLSGGAGAMMGFTDALVASEKGGRPVTGATPGYNYPAEETISGVEPGVVGPSTNKSSLEQLFSNIGAIMPSGIGAETRQADEIVKARARAAAAGYGQADTGGVPTQTLAQMEAAQAAPPQGAAPPPAPTGGIADLATAQTQVAQPTSFEAVTNQAKELAKKYKTDSGTTKDFTAFSKEYVDTLKNAGYDFDLVKNNISKLAEEKETLKGERKEATNLRLLEAGLGILGGESPYAFVNIGKGATPALQGLAKDIKDIKKTRRELDKETMQLNLLQNQMAEGKVKYAQGRLDKQEDRAAKAAEKNAEIEFRIADRMSSNSIQKYVADQQTQTSRMNLQATQLDRTAAREATLAENAEKRDAAYKKAAIEQAAEDVKLLPAEQQAAEKRKRAKQYYDMLKAKDFGSAPSGNVLRFDAQGNLIK